MILAIALLLGCPSREVVCDDGWDGDRDGRIDCIDSDCFCQLGCLCDADVDGDLATAQNDCNDNNPEINASADDVCNGVDDDCDGRVDDEDGDTKQAPFWYEDADEDGFGNVASTRTLCEAQPGWVADSTDCDDANSEIPGANETCEVGDEDCDGALGLNDPDVGPLNPAWADDDLDGWGDPAVPAVFCEALPSGLASNDLDCDDNNPQMTIGWHWMLDEDGDGYGVLPIVVTTARCIAPGTDMGPESEVDCDDTQVAISPGSHEIPHNDVDDDCDGTVDEKIVDSLADFVDTTWTLDPDSANTIDIIRDLDGDGLDEVLVASPYALDFGRIDRLSAAGVVPWWRGAAGRTVGAGRLGAGVDADADGVFDLLLGLNGEFDGPGGFGWALGPHDAFPTRSTTELDSVVLGAIYAQSFGRRLDVADLTEDGRADVIAADKSPTSSVWLFDTTLPAEGLSDLATQSVSNLGDGPDVAILGDVDGDGVSEWAIGDPTSSRVLLFSGITPGIQPAGDALATIVGTPYSAFGTWVVAVGDVDADGLQDLAAASNDPLTGGTVYLFSLPSPVAPVQVADIESIIADSYCAKNSLGAVGDLHADGYTDLLVTCAHNVAIFHGPIAGSMNFADADITLLEEFPSGPRVPRASGDTDGDGLDDAFIARPSTGDVWRLSPPL